MSSWRVWSGGEGDSVTQLTLMADAVALDGARLPDGFAVSSPRASDADELGRLYFDCQVPGADLADTADGIAETRAFFRGEFGEFWAAASGVIESGDRLVAAPARRAPGSVGRHARLPLCHRSVHPSGLPPVRVRPCAVDSLPERS